ncbi:MAG: hypothetical protein RL514_1361 [Verrucomicrobiota bacterium]|jgi:hypothetical protein
MKTPLILIAIGTLAVGCATAPKDAVIADGLGDLPSVQSVLADRLSQLKIGMSLEDFRRVMPEAYVGGQSEATTAYEVAKSLKYVTQADIARHNLIWGAGSPPARSQRAVLWFYFYKDQLVKWGRPQDWPDKPDIILEKRIR